MTGTSGSVSAGPEDSVRILAIGNWRHDAGPNPAFDAPLGKVQGSDRFLAPAGSRSEGLLSEVLLSEVLSGGGISSVWLRHLTGLAVRNVDAAPGRSEWLALQVAGKSGQALGASGFLPELVQESSPGSFRATSGEAPRAARPASVG
ncbi:MAG: hypothetical protein LBR80_10445 [Deltaproteobacteria bacterium]|nr:hypothetical protein [Deltaproteobacteria bacterium]